MTKECRAKDPSSCRVHGSADTVQNLKETASSAADSGNIDLYLSARAKLDSMDASNFSSPTIPVKAVEAAAKAEWELAATSPTSWEKLGSDWKAHYQKDAFGSLEAAQRDMPFGRITDQAVEETAKYNWEYRDSKHNWERHAALYQKNQYRLEAKTSLEAAAPHMPKQTTEAVSKVLGKTYDRFGFNNDKELIAHFVEILEDPAQAVPEDEGDASPAAERIRTHLWNRYTGGGASASATSDLFYALGREKELGWVKEQVPGYRYDPEDFA
jgi:hypothetical protein